MKRFSVDFGLQFVELVQGLAGAQAIHIQCFQQFHDRVRRRAAKQVVLGRLGGGRGCGSLATLAFQFREFYLGEDI